MTAEERNKDILRRVCDKVMNQGNLGAALEFFTPNFIRNDLASLIDGVSGASGVKDLIGMVRGAIPDIHATIEDMIAEGDKVVARFTLRGTHKGEFLGVPATGRSISVAVINIYRFEDGKIAEVWQLPDALGVMRQLGAVR